MDRAPSLVMPLWSHTPFAPTSTASRTTSAQTSGRRNTSTKSIGPGTAASGAAWGTPAIFTYGNGGRNILRGPGRENVDFSLFKNFQLTERFKLQFRAEMFNLFNHAQFDIPNASVGNPNAGIITGIVGSPRQMQFALRLTF